MFLLVFTVHSDAMVRKGMRDCSLRGGVRHLTGHQMDLFRNGGVSGDGLAGEVGGASLVPVNLSLNAKDNFKTSKPQTKKK